MGKKMNDSENKKKMPADINHDSISFLDASILETSNGEKLVQYLRRKRGIGNCNRIFNNTTSPNKSFPIEVVELREVQPAATGDELQKVEEPKKDISTELAQQSPKLKSTRILRDKSPSRSSSSLKRLSTALGKRVLLQEFEKTVQEKHFHPEAASTPIVGHTISDLNLSVISHIRPEDVDKTLSNNDENAPNENVEKALQKLHSEHQKENLPENPNEENTENTTKVNVIKHSIERYQEPIHSESVQKHQEPINRESVQKHQISINKESVSNEKSVEKLQRPSYEEFIQKHHESLKISTIQKSFKGTPLNKTFLQPTSNEHNSLSSNVKNNRKNQSHKHLNNITIRSPSQLKQPRLLLSRIKLPTTTSNTLNSGITSPLKNVMKTNERIDCNYGKPENLSSHITTDIQKQTNNPMNSLIIPETQEDEMNDVPKSHTTQPLVYIPVHQTFCEPNNGIEWMKDTENDQQKIQVILNILQTEKSLSKANCEKQSNEKNEESSINKDAQPPEMNVQQDEILTSEDHFDTVRVTGQRTKKKNLIITDDEEEGENLYSANVPKSNCNKIRISRNNGETDNHIVENVEEKREKAKIIDDYIIEPVIQDNHRNKHSKQQEPGSEPEKHVKLSKLSKQEVQLQYKKSGSSSRSIAPLYISSSSSNSSVESLLQNFDENLFEQVDDGFDKTSKNNLVHDLTPGSGRKLFNQIMQNKEEQKCLEISKRGRRTSNRKMDPILESYLKVGDVLKKNKGSHNSTGRRKLYSKGVSDDEVLERNNTQRQSEFEKSNISVFSLENPRNTKHGHSSINQNSKSKLRESRSDDIQLSTIENILADWKSKNDENTINSVYVEIENNTDSDKIFKKPLHRAPKSTIRTDNKNTSTRICGMESHKNKNLNREITNSSNEENNSANSSHRSATKSIQTPEDSRHEAPNNKNLSAQISESRSSIKKRNDVSGASIDWNGISNNDDDGKTNIETEKEFKKNGSLSMKIIKSPQKENDKKSNRKNVKIRRQSSSKLFGNVEPSSSTNKSEKLKQKSSQKDGISATTNQLENKDSSGGIIPGSKKNTKNKAIKTKEIEINIEESMPVNGVRRSSRKRRQPVAYWSNRFEFAHENPIYQGKPNNDVKKKRKAKESNLNVVDEENHIESAEPFDVLKNGPSYNVQVNKTLEKPTPKSAELRKEKKKTRSLKKTKNLTIGLENQVTTTENLVVTTRKEPQTLPSDDPGIDKSPLNPMCGQTTTDSGNATDNQSEQNLNNNKQINNNNGSSVNTSLEWLINLAESKSLGASSKIVRVLQFPDNISVAAINDLTFFEYDGVDYAYYVDTKGTTLDNYGYMKFHPKSVKRKSKTKLYDLRFLILVGTVELVMDKTNYNVNMGDFVTIPKGARYKLANISNEPALLLFIKS